MPQQSHASYAAVLSAQSELSYREESLKSSRGANPQRVRRRITRTSVRMEMKRVDLSESKKKTTTTKQKALLLAFHCLIILLGDLIHASKIRDA